jgi:hypothetical protein
MNTRLAIAVLVAGTSFSMPVHAANGIGWGPDDRGERTVAVRERVLIRDRDGRWDRGEPVVHYRSYRHPTTARGW